MKMKKHLILFKHDYFLSCCCFPLEHESAAPPLVTLNMMNLLHMYASTTLLMENSMSGKQNAYSTSIQSVLIQASTYICFA